MKHLYIAFKGLCVVSWLHLDPKVQIQSLLNTIKTYLKLKVFFGFAQIHTTTQVKSITL